MILVGTSRIEDSCFGVTRWILGGAGAPSHRVVATAYGWVGSTEPAVTRRTGGTSSVPTDL